MIDLPLYMRTEPKEFYKSFMEERNIFSIFVQSHIRKDVDDILTQINQHIDNNYPNQVAVWVGGSRSWNTSMDCRYGSSLDMNSLERNAIIPGNYDVFVISNDISAHNDVLCRLKNLIEKYTKRFKDGPLGNAYQLENVLGNIEKNCDIQYPTQKSSCTLFPCQSIMVKIKSKQYKKYTTRKSIKLERSSSASDLSSPFTDSRSVFSSQEFDEISGSVSQDTNDDFPKIVNYKLLIYVESAFLPNVNIHLFKNALLFSDCKGDEMTIKYLNPVGLLLMSEFISTPRKHKGLNVDEFRKKMLLKVVEWTDSITPYNAYTQILDIYMNIFGNSAFLDKYLVQTLLQQMMRFSNIIDIKEEIERQFIPTIRPFVNSFLRDLEFDLMSFYKDNVFFAIVGGDAMRRYNINISNTSDFDTKLFVNTKNIKSNKIEEMLIDNLSRFVTFLNKERSTFLTTAQKIYTINTENNFYVKPTLLTNDNQFRLRYIKKNPTLPIDLFSLDFRANLDVQYRNGSVNMYIDIPFLDIAVIKNGNTRTKYQKDDVVDVYKSRVVPIAKLDFLLDDLNTTYTTPSLAAARYWNDKIGKDTRRYTLLQEVKNNNGPERQVRTDDDMLIDTPYSDRDLDVVVAENIWEGINNTINVKNGEKYAEAFKSIIDKSKKDKYKMKFTYIDPDTYIDPELTDVSDMEID